MKRRAELAAFLRERRRGLAPEDLGLARRGRRHVKGLRRDEVARVAGIGVSWYTLIEQARDVNVSLETVARIAQALRLDPFETTHLLGLARTDVATASYAAIDPATLAQIQPILDSQRLDPAHVLDEALTAVAWNALAQRFYGFRPEGRGFENNVLWRLFNDRAFANIFADYDRAVANLTGMLRFNYARSIEYPPYEALVHELYANHPVFARIWDSHHVQARQNETCYFDHPVAGKLVLRLLFASVAAEPPLKIVFLTPADPASSSALEHFENSVLVTSP